MKHNDLWLKANKLSLNVAKTESMIISSGQKLQSAIFKWLHEDGVQVKPNNS